MYFKKHLRSKFHPCFYDNFLLHFMKKERCTKFYGILVGCHEVIKLGIFEFSVSNVISANVQNISTLVFFAFFVILMEKKLPECFIDHFSRNYEIAEFWIIYLFNKINEILNDLNLDVSDVILENETPKHANCCLHVNLWNFLLTPFCFTVEKDILSKRCYFGFRSPSKNI